ncbi:MAG: hypothetical protein JF615_02800, partial [Asticcacaulis sp.]|nr:hypothetical protein [Asticcacaulis sp.]
MVKDGHHYGKIDGIVVCDGENSERVWQETLDEVHRRNPKFFGYDGAKSRFLYFFPKGFEDQNFLANERGYKIEAKESLESELTPEVALTGAGYGEIVLRAFRDTNL